MPTPRALTIAIACLGLFLAVAAPLAAHAGTNLMKVWPDTLQVPMQRLEIVPAMRPARKSVGVALSGGGANGLAQIGVLKAFEEEGVPVDFIAGTSMGAIIGGLYSCGYTPGEIDTIARTIPWKSVISLRNTYPRADAFYEQQRVRDRATIAIRFEKLKLVIPKALSSSQAVTETLDLLVLNAPYHAYGNFSNLPVHFRAVTTDLVTGARVTLNSGSLSEAIRASSTVPILFKPIAKGEHQLVDGGLVANLPVDELGTFGSQYRIAVDTHGSMYTSAKEIDLPWKAADQAMGILTRQQYPAQLAMADIVVAPDLGTHQATNFDDIDQLIEEGYRKGKALARTILRSIAATPSSKGGSISLEGYRRTVHFPEDRVEYIEHYHVVSGIIRNATTTGEALKAILETDLFSRADATVDSRKKTVRFNLTPLPTIHAINIDGDLAGAIPQNELAACFKPIMAKTYTNRAGTRSLEALIGKFREHGYSLASLEHIQVEGGTLHIRTNSGRIEGIAIERSQDITNQLPIEREITVDTTKALRIGNAEESVDNLYGMGVFNQVSVSVDAKNTPDTTAPQKTLRFQLDEKPTDVLRIGLRYDETDNAQILIDYRNENLNGTTGSLGGWLKASNKNNAAALEFNMPRIGATQFTLSSRIFYDELRFDYQEPEFNNSFFSRDTNDKTPYGIQKYGFTTAFGTRVQKNGKFIVDATIMNAESYLDGTSSGPIPTGNNDMLLIGTQLAIDSRNSPELPTRGNLTDIRYTYATPALANSDPYWQLFGLHEENIPLSEQTTLQVSGTVGISGGTVPLSDQYMLGGSGNTYSKRFIGLKSYALIGNNIATLGANIRYTPTYEIIFPASFIFYYNTGNAWNERSEMGFKHLIHGIGTGIVWDTPIGPARFTIAKAFAFLENAEDEETSSLGFSETVFYFSVGHDF